jgi:hypothetical protein
MKLEIWNMNKKNRLCLEIECITVIQLITKSSNLVYLIYTSLQIMKDTKIIEKIKFQILKSLIKGKAVICLRCIVMKK